MSKGIFITATGTDVGKTFVTALIVKLLRQHGLNAGYYKAALSGAEYIDGKLIAGDAQYVCDVSLLKEEPNSLVSYIYETAVSPHLASQIENKPVEMDVILSDFNKVKDKFDFITVEGSGGIVCPIRMDHKTIMLTDIIKELNLDVIIIAPAALGSINSTVLTVNYTKNLGICIKGIILNQYDKENFLHLDNKNKIEELTGIPVIACVPEHSSNLDIDIEALIALYKEI